MSWLSSSGAVPRAVSAFSVLSILRIFAGLELLEHGTGKILGFPVVPNWAHVQITSLTGLGGLIELVGGILFTIGLFTRPVAFILSALRPPPISWRMPARDSIRC